MPIYTIYIDLKRKINLRQTFDTIKDDILYANYEGKIKGNNKLHHEGFKGKGFYGCIELILGIKNKNHQRSKIRIFSSFIQIPNSSTRHAIEIFNQIINILKFKDNQCNYVLLRHPSHKIVSKFDDDLLSQNVSSIVKYMVHAFTISNTFGG